MAIGGERPYGQPCQGSLVVLFHGRCAQRMVGRDLHGWPYPVDGRLCERDHLQQAPLILNLLVINNCASSTVIKILTFE